MPVSKSRREVYGIDKEDTNTYLRLLALKSNRDGAPAMLGDVITDARQDFEPSGDVVCCSKYECCWI